MKTVHHIAALHPAKYAPHACPRCREEFVCASGTPCLCACFALDLTPAELRFIEERYERECVCIACLRILQEEFHNQR